MLSITDIRLQSMATHYVGNKAAGDELKLSRQLVGPEMTEELRSVLLQYMLTPFQEEGSFRFQHPTDLNLNEIYSYTARIFDRPELLLVLSSYIASHLHDSMNLPNIKSGELHIAYFTGVPFKGIMTDAIGIYKTDRLDTFLKIQPTQQGYQFTTDTGINPLLLEKGCLIINTNRPEGFELFIVDKGSKGGHAQFWKDIFLKVQASGDDFHVTSDYMQMTKGFIMEHIPTEFELSKTDQIALLNKTTDYFKKNEQFDVGEFKQSVFNQPELINSFEGYSRLFVEDYQTKLPDQFDISAGAVRKSSKHFKKVLKLDKNFHVYVHGDPDLIERGYDEGVGMNYYKIYFKEED